MTRWSRRLFFPFNIGTREGAHAPHEQSFDSFYASEFPSVFHAAVAFCGNEHLAFDATQEAFARAFARWFRLSRDPEKTGWVMTTVTKICKRRARASARTLRAERTSDVCERETGAAPHSALAAVSALPVGQRQAVVLHYVADQPPQVVADLMNVSPSGLKKRLSRAERQLQKEFESTRG